MLYTSNFTWSAAYKSK